MTTIMIYVFSGIKGGSGRSTIAEQLTIWLARVGADVLLVDADEQGTASDFTAWREHTLDGRAVIPLAKWTLFVEQRNRLTLAI